MGVVVKYIGLAVFLTATHFVNAQVFSEKAGDLGVDHFAYDPNMIGGGVAVFDFNNDGFEDIYFTGGSNDDKLYENIGNGTFEDVTKKMRITALNTVKTMGVVVGDVDNDGFIDLFITTSENQRCYLLKNEGGRLFKDISISAGITHEAWSSTATMADYDLDGDLDIYVGNYLSYSEDPFMQNIISCEPDFFYQNDGTGRFIKIDNPLTTEQTGCTLVASFSDIDQDGDVDLFVLNDFGDFYQGNKLLLNNLQQNTFQEIAKISGMNIGINSMGIAHGDYDEDGDLDYYITNIGENFLFEKQNSLKFVNVSKVKKVDDGTGFSWGAAFLDIDNDSYLDLFVCKGSILSSADPQPNKLFMFNPETKSFTDASKENRVDEPNRARGMAYGDLNNDGKLDLVVANVRIELANQGNALLYINESDSKNNWIKVMLEGTSSNRSGYGSMLKVTSNERTWIRELSGGSSYLSSHSNTIHFGLSDKQSIDNLTVSWPGNKEEIFTNLPANKTYKIVEDKGIYIYEARYVEMCQGESMFLQGEDRIEPGVYVDTLNVPETIDKIVVTKLAFREFDIESCSQIVTNIEQPHDSMGIMVYPNPFYADLNIKLPKRSVGKYDLSIMDVSGRVMLTTAWNANYAKELKIIEAFNPGIYILKLEINGEVFIERIIKK